MVTLQKDKKNVYVNSDMHTLFIKFIAKYYKPADVIFT